MSTDKINANVRETDLIMWKRSPRRKHSFSNWLTQTHTRTHARILCWMRKITKRKKGRKKNLETTFCKHSPWPDSQPRRSVPSVVLYMHSEPSFISWKERNIMWKSHFCSFCFLFQLSSFAMTLRAYISFFVLKHIAFHFQWKKNTRKFKAISAET